MRLLPQQARAHNSPGVDYFVERIVVEVEDVRINMSGGEVLRMSREDFEAGVVPEGWDFYYADPDDEIAKWPNVDQVMVVSWRWMPASAIPVDRYFRDAWCDTSPEPVIDHDMEKCVAIHKDVLRAMRAPKFAPLDNEFNKALGTKNTALQAEIEAKRQALRDVTADPRIDTAETADALKAIIPDVLAA